MPLLDVGKPAIYLQLDILVPRLARVADWVVEANLGTPKRVPTSIPSSRAVVLGAHCRTLLVDIVAAQVPGPGRLHLLHQRLLTCREEDDGIPDALKWEHASAGQAELEADISIVRQAEEPIDGARNPGNEDGKGKDEAGPQVGYLDRIEALQFQRISRLHGLESHCKGAPLCGMAIRGADCLKIGTRHTWDGPNSAVDIMVCMMPSTSNRAFPGLARRAS